MSRPKLSFFLVELCACFSQWQKGLMSLMGVPCYACSSQGEAADPCLHLTPPWPPHRHQGHLDQGQVDSEMQTWSFLLSHVPGLGPTLPRGREAFLNFIKVSPLSGTSSVRLGSSHLGVPFSSKHRGYLDTLVPELLELLGFGACCIHYCCWCGRVFI